MVVMVVIVVMVVMVVVVLFDIVVWWYGGNGDGGDGSNRSLFNHLPPWAPRATQRSVGRDFQNWDNSVYGEDGYRIYRWQRHTPNPGIHFGSSFSDRIIFHPIIGVFQFWHGSNLHL